MYKTIQDTLYVRNCELTCTYIHVHAPGKHDSIPKFYVFVFLYAEKLKELGENVKCNFLLNHNILESNSY